MTALILFAGAWLGHAFALTVALNVVYARPLPKTLLKAGRWFVAAVVFAFPAWAYHNRLILDQHTFASIYWNGCVIVGFGVVPAVTLMRALRKPPAALLAKSGKVIDFAQRLGRRPVGDGKHRWLARLPGNQLYQVEFTELTLRVSTLPPALDGMSVLHLTDLHFHGTPDVTFFDAVFRELAADAAPDLICVTGDLVDSTKHHAWVGRLLGQLRWTAAGVAILGNHDWHYDPDGVRRELARVGWRVVGNGWAEVTVRSERVVILGDERPWFRAAAAWSDAPAGPWRLALTHTPDNFADARHRGAGLVLAGHVHGGQVRVPLLGSLFVPSRYSRRYDAGVFEEAGCPMVVGRGLSGREPLRWGCRPEVIRLTLRSGAAPDY